MPCQSYGPTVTTAEMLAPERRKVRALKKEADKVTRLLCAVLREYEIEMSDELSEWLEKHDAADVKAMAKEAAAKAKRREKKERADALKRNRKAGMKKLTSAERKALGL